MDKLVEAAKNLQEAKADYTVAEAELEDRRQAFSHARCEFTGVVRVLMGIRHLKEAVFLVDGVAYYCTRRPSEGVTVQEVPVIKDEDEEAMDA